MEMPKTPQVLNSYLDRHFNCSCGKEHYASLKTVVIKKDALLDLPETMGSFLKKYLPTETPRATIRTG